MSCGIPCRFHAPAGNMSKSSGNMRKDASYRLVKADLRDQTSDLRPHPSRRGLIRSRFCSFLRPACSLLNSHRHPHNRAVLRDGGNSALRRVNLKQPKETADIPFCYFYWHPRQCWLERNSPHAAAAESSGRKLPLVESLSLSCKLLR